MHKQIENLTIEQMREIVEGAPEGFDTYSFKEKKYVRSDWFLGEVSLNDLRTAIAEHDTDHVTDIRNHVSPGTKVIDHG